MRPVFRRVLLLLTLTITMVANAQRQRDYPFQVIHSKGVVSKSLSLPLSDLNYVHVDDSLGLQQGHLIIAHQSGVFFEFEGDTTVLISELLQHPRIARSDCDLNQRFAMLHETRWKKTKGVTSGAVLISRPRSPINLKLPSRSIDVPSPKTCFQWSTEGNLKGPFTVELRDIFNNILDWHRTDNLWLDVDLSSYENESGLFILRVFHANNPEVISDTYGLQLSLNGCRNYLRSCRFSKPVDALEAAFLYETSYNDLKEAHRLYVKAKHTSAQPIYDKLLSNFRERHDSELDALEE
ncbi:MAG: hypothetical protein AAGA85_16740 [Bacteroidota bacterium]